MEALRELDTTLFGPDQEAIASDSDDASADTLSTAKRVDRSVDDDEYFSNVNVASPPAPAAEGTDDLELAAIAADVLELRSNGCGCGTNHYLMCPEGELVSLMISTLKRLSKQDKNMFDLGELTASLHYRLSALQLESDNTASLHLPLHGSQDMPHVFHENPCHRIVHIAYTTGSGSRRSGYTTPHESAGCVAGNVHESQAHTVLGQWMFRPIEKKFQVQRGRLHEGL